MLEVGKHLQVFSASFVMANTQSQTKLLWDRRYLLQIWLESKPCSAIDPYVMSYSHLDSKTLNATSNRDSGLQRCNSTQEK